MNRKVLLISLLSLTLALLANPYFSAIGATTQSKEIQTLQKKVKTLEASVKALQDSVETLKSSDLEDADSISAFKAVQSRKLSFVAFLGRDLKCPTGSTPAEKLDGREVEKGFPDGFSFKNIRVFGLLGGAQINLGGCEMTVLSK